MNLLRIIYNLSLFLCLSLCAAAQIPAAALMPVPRFCPPDANGNPLPGGLLYTYFANTTTPLATYVDALGTIQNTNPVQLDGAGCAAVWFGPQNYKVVLTDANNAQQWMTDNVSDVGLQLYSRAVLLNPTGGVLQTIAGPLQANYFQQTTPHFTSPGVRVAILDPLSKLDTATNPPNLTTTAPTLPGQNYTIPDPGTPQANFVLNPNGTGNVLDCTQAGITCKRTAYVYFDGGSCNNATPFLNWDTFGTNAPTPLCITGSNIQKGIMALPSAATMVQSATCTGAAATTCVVAMPAALTAHNLPIMACAVDGGKTVSGITDGTNAYTKAVNVANGNTDAEIWYFNGDAATASGNVTVTLSAGANSACKWREYSGLLVASMLDKTASNTGTGTAVTTGTTTGTAQNTELVFAAVASPSNPSVTGANGWTQHPVVSQSTNVTVSSEGLIQQATATQAGSFTLGTSQAWASAIATFKVSVASDVSGQRSLTLPSFFDNTRQQSAAIKWQAPLSVLGTVNVKLGAALACSPDGNTDDPAFNTTSSAAATVNASSANSLATTSFTNVDITNCAASGMLHYKVLRQRYDPADTYEGYVYVDGASLNLAVSQ